MMMFAMNSPLASSAGLSQTHKNQQKQSQILPSPKASSSSCPDNVLHITDDESEHIQLPSIKVPQDKKSGKGTPSTKSGSLSLQWLAENFEVAENAHIAREIIYNQYCIFCEQNGYSAMNAASFGKIIRSVFPTISTRRLGTRGNSKYHYYGIRPKGDWIPYVEGTKPTKARPSKSNASLPSASASQTSLPSIFVAGDSASPSAEVGSLYRAPPSNELLQDLLRFSLPDYAKFDMGASMEHISEFLRLYREHCESLAREGLQGHFDQFGRSLVSFWTELSSTFNDILSYREMCRVVADWDTVVYQAMLTVFLPDILGPGDKAMLKELRNFSVHLPQLINLAFENKPEPIHTEKSRVVVEFGKIVKQYYHLNHLALSANNIMSQRQLVEKMVDVWSLMEFENVSAQALYVCPNAAEVLRVVQENVHHRLYIKANVNQWAEWVFAMTEEYLNADTQNFEEFIFHAQQFIIKWTYVSSLILRELGEKRKDVFAPFHLLRLFCDEYIKYLIDCKIDEKRRHFESLPVDSWQSSAIPPLQQGIYGMGMDVFGSHYGGDLNHDYYSPSASASMHFPSIQQFGTHGSSQYQSPLPATALPMILGTEGQDQQGNAFLSGNQSNMVLSSALNANDAVGEEAHHLGHSLVKKELHVEHVSHLDVLGP